MRVFDRLPYKERIALINRVDQVLKLIFIREQYPYERDFACIKWRFVFSGIDG